MESGSEEEGIDEEDIIPSYDIRDKLREDLDNAAGTDSLAHHEVFKDAPNPVICILLATSHFRCLSVISP
jgi:hypothetical protein